MNESKAANNKKKVDADKLPDVPEILKVKKKPVVVSALLFNGDNSDQIRKYTKGKWTEKKNGKYFINTLEGEMEASVGDYIIQGVDNDFYAIKPDIFKKTYVDKDGNAIKESKSAVVSLQEFMEFREGGSEPAVEMEFRVFLDYWIDYPPEKTMIAIYNRIYDYLMEIYKPEDEEPFKIKQKMLRRIAGEATNEEEAVISEAEFLQTFSRPK